LPPGSQKTIVRLNEIFWEEIPKFPVGRIIFEVNPVGGSEKARALEDIARKENIRPGEILYVGDSITDVQAFELVQANGGVGVSFNGNSYALRAASVCVLAPDTAILALLGAHFKKRGPEGLIEDLKSGWGETLKEYGKVDWVTDENRAALTRESEAFRRKVRGVAVGSLG
jgi:energy-converting hydrogenase A subunit R